MPRRQNQRSSAPKQVEANKTGVFDFNLSALTKYKWTVEKANALLGSMIGLKPAGKLYITHTIIDECFCFDNNMYKNTLYDIYATDMARRVLLYIKTIDDI